MLDVQEIRFQLLLEADEICRENGIRYALFGATALRAHARHCFGDGEDSVVKIAMYPRDAMRFVEAVEREGRPDRYLEYLGNNPDVGRINIRYGNRNTIDFVPADTAAFSTASSPLQSMSSSTRTRTANTPPSSSPRSRATSRC